MPNEESLISNLFDKLRTPVRGDSDSSTTLRWLCPALQQLQLVNVPYIPSSLLAMIIAPNDSNAGEDKKAPHPLNQLRMTQCEDFPDNDPVVGEN
ncbi:hypothetical protein FRC02_011722 [Tulasnella sp. 418]|nr:hypothetical protein FRC02_011722 [Tulasnella sp. 418]